MKDRSYNNLKYRESFFISFLFTFLLWFQVTRPPEANEYWGADNSRNLGGGVWRQAPSVFSSVLGSDTLPKSALQIRSLGTSRSGLIWTARHRSILSASLDSFIFFNKSKLGSHFASLSVLLCLIQTEIIGRGVQAPPAPRFRRPWVRNLIMIALSNHVVKGRAVVAKGDK